MLAALPFRHIVVADFEFHFGGHASADEANRSGERPLPVCLVAKDLCTGQQMATMGRRVRPGRTLPHRDRFALCCFLRQRRARLFQGARLVDASQCSRSLC
jgi:hypothetical protein